FGPLDAARQRLSGRFDRGSGKIAVAARRRGEGTLFELEKRFIHVTAFLIFLLKPAARDQPKPPGARRGVSILCLHSASLGRRLQFDRRKSPRREERVRSEEKGARCAIDGMRLCGGRLRLSGRGL